MEELKVGDKIDIRCDTGKAYDTKIIHKGSELKHVSSISINVSPCAIDASIALISPVINLKDVEISEIVDSNPKINMIKDIISEYHMGKNNVVEQNTEDFIKRIAEIL